MEYPKYCVECKSNKTSPRSHFCDWCYQLLLKEKIRNEG